MKTQIKNIARIASFCYAALFLLLFVRVSQAHPMLASQVELTPFEDHWQLTLKLPDNRLAVALKQKPTQALLAPYVIKHINVSSGDEGSLWEKEVGLIKQPDGHGHRYWKVNVKLLPPEGVDISSFDIDYQVITERIITHRVIFWLMQDNLDGKSTKPPTHLGNLRGDQTKISVGR